MSNKIKLVMAVDPGEMTGYATAAWNTDSNEYRINKWGHERWKDFVLGYAEHFRWDTVVYETWLLRRENAMQLVGSDLQSVQCVGVVRFQAWVHDVPLIAQSPQIKPFIDKRMGGEDYLPGREGVEHHRDALRHLHYYLTVKKEAEWIDS